MSIITHALTFYCLESFSQPSWLRCQLGDDAVRMYVRIWYVSTPEERFVRLRCHWPSNFCGSISMLSLPLAMCPDIANLLLNSPTPVLHLTGLFYPTSHKTFLDICLSRCSRKFWMNVLVVCDFEERAN